MTKGFKAFDKDLSCKGFKFEVGKTYTHDGEVNLCATGFHFCENPLRILGYYPAAGSRFAEVEADGIGDKSDPKDKSVSKTITVKAELSLSAVIQAGIKFVFDRVDWTKAEEVNKKESGAASATGYSGAASATGNRGAAVSLGPNAKARAGKGGWITLSEWKKNSESLERITVKTVRVDGKKIKADTFYTLKGGKFVVAE